MRESEFRSENDEGRLALSYARSKLCRTPRLFRRLPRNSMKDTLPDRVRLGAFELDLKVGELRLAAEPEDESRIVLPDQPFRLLLMLVEREGMIVTREEIQKKFWPNDTIVEFDHSINVAIGKLRKALGDSADEPKYIETLARRGYRLMVPVEWIEQLPVARGQLSEPAPLGTARASVDSASLIGKKVSHYRVLQVIGAGGMGLVYKAEDLKLGRQVALKFLPEEMAGDAAALQRFQREAQTASSLNHPNICTIHEVEDHEAKPFIVMELLEGESLRDCLARFAASHHAMPLDQLLDIGIQIAAGLQAAHDRSIIHRDIKPANLFLTSSGQVKILDFGVAKLAAATESFTAVFKIQLRKKAEDASLPITTERNLTQTGSAVGTAGYMSPEQVRGEKLDARSDLFSLGLVLYEMATGQRAFSGATAEVVHDAILKNSPVSLRELNSGLPAKLASTIDKALAKDREQRYQSAAEMCADLRGLRGHGSTPSRRSRWMLAAVAAVVLCAAVFLVLRLKPRKPELIKEPTVRPLIPGSADSPILGLVALSPDGKHLAYGDEVNGLSILQIDTGESRSFPNTAAFRPVSWLPDGDHLLVSKLGQPGTWKMSTMDGTTRKFHDGSMTLYPSPVGQQLAFFDGHTLRVEDPGQSPRELISFDSNRDPGFLAWAPTGHRIAYDNLRSEQPDTTKVNKAEANLGTCDLAGHCSTVLFNPGLSTGTDLSSLAWLPDGRIVFSLRELPPNDGSANLWSLYVDPATGKASGEPRRLTNWSGVEPKSLSASADGTRLALLQTHNENRIKIAELRADGTMLGKTRSLDSETWQAVPAGWTRDSRAVLFTGDRHGQRGIFKQSIDNATAEILVSGAAGRNVLPVLSPDGQWLFYTQYPAGAPPRLMRSPVAGGPPTILLSGDYGYRCAIAPSGLCVVSELKGDRLVFSRLDPLKGRGEDLLSTQVKGSSTGWLAYAWSLSSDGKSIALVDRGSGAQVRILGIDGGVRVIPLGGWPHLQTVNWAADGRHLYISGGRDLAADEFTWAILETDLSGNFKVLIQLPGDRGWFSHLVPSPDGRYLTYNESDFTSSVVMLEKF